MVVVKTVVPRPVIEDKLADALIEAKDQRSIEAPQVEEDEKMEVVQPVVVTIKVVKEDGEWLGCTTEVAEDNREFCPLFSTAPLTPISKAHNDDHSMDVDNGGEFQSTHPPSIKSSIWMDEKRRDMHDSFIQ